MDTTSKSFVSLYNGNIAAMATHIGTPQCYDSKNAAKGSLIGIINYHVAAHDGKPDLFYIQFARGSALVQDLDNHLQHIQNTKEYLHSQGYEEGIDYDIEKLYDSHYTRVNPGHSGEPFDVGVGYQGVKITFKK